MPGWEPSILIPSGAPPQPTSCSLTESPVMLAGQAEPREDRLEWQTQKQTIRA